MNLHAPYRFKQPPTPEIVEFLVAAQRLGTIYKPLADNVYDLRRQIAETRRYLRDDTALAASGKWTTTFSTADYACDKPAAGHALRDADGGAARGDEAPTTIAVPACMRHAWDPVSHPALDRLAPRPPLRLHPSTITSAIEFGWPTPETPRHRHSDKPQGALFAVAVRQLRRTVGVAIIGRPVAQALQDGVTAEVTRLCTAQEAGAPGSDPLGGGRGQGAPRGRGAGRLRARRRPTRSGHR